MRRAATLIAAVAAAAVLLSSAVGPALAASHCTDPADREMFDVTALKSRLMVLATGCGDSSQYNAFMTKYQPQLADTDKNLQAYFKRHYGRTAQREYDGYITALANGQSRVGISEGSDFCPHDAMIFQEVMALPASSDLPAYAAGKDIVPDTVGACVVPEPAPAPAHASARKPARKAHK